MSILYWEKPPASKSISGFKDKAETDNELLIIIKINVSKTLYPQNMGCLCGLALCFLGFCAFDWHSEQDFVLNELQLACEDNLRELGLLWLLSQKHTFGGNIE